MCKKNNNISDVERLKSNAVFQLSLSSKELFHSNFLYWMAIDTELPDTFFPNLMKEAFGFEFADITNWRIKYEFLREYENFDFCICKKLEDSSDTSTDEDDQETNYEKHGPIVFLLENKFKSLPHKDQLVRYSEKSYSLILNSEIEGIKKKYKGNAKKFNKNQITGLNDIDLYDNLLKVVSLLNGKNKNDIERNKAIALNLPQRPKYALLSLIEPSFAKDNDEWKATINQIDYSWKIVTYEKYAVVLDKLLRSIEDKFRKSLIKNYFDFISTFTKKITETLSKINDGKFLDAFRNDPFPYMRVDDIWQKLVADKIDSMVADCLEKNPKHFKIIHADAWEQSQKNGKDYKNADPGIIVHGADYTRSSGVFTVRIMLQDGYSFNIQVQNGQYRRCLEYWGKNKSERNSYKKKALETEILNTDHDMKFLNEYIRFGNNDSSQVRSPSFSTESPLPIKNKDITPNMEIYDAKPGQRGFCKYGYDFVYQYWQISTDVTIDQIIVAICMDIISVYNELKNHNLLECTTQTP